ncbi:hypothetical protein Acsp06_09090 [Actinomycetospora sp. NBRC 106375]|uniref:hypothetical protein n=1 Tax=Actinomycetospora sp. NBRC 106375 TaxID=3032207 RepID=UPI0024A3F4E5|nr:hypothetical protein [Actinomycetospora sp. NBRC 106375]GLZ44724.1 hypothetical protein Acsp06_09090 [Actinomycetospora sp. NBRC 106375]
MPAHRATRRTRRARAAALGSLTLLSVVGPGTGMAFAAGNDVHNCGDFRYQEDAQEVYDADTSDPNQLDDDNDDEACEKLPHRPSSSSPITDVDLGDGSSTGSSSGSRAHEGSRPAVSSGSSHRAASATSPVTTDRDCADFASRDDAQDALDADPSDPERLDADDDGQACESFDYGDSDSDDETDTDTDTDRVASDSDPAPVVAQTASDYPVGGVAAGDGSAPSGASDVLTYGLLGAAAVAGATGVRYVGRHRRA